MKVFFILADKQAEQEEEDIAVELLDVIQLNTVKMHPLSYCPSMNGDKI